MVEKGAGHSQVDFSTMPPSRSEGVRRQTAGLKTEWIEQIASVPKVCGPGHFYEWVSELCIHITLFGYITQGWVILCG